MKHTSRKPIANNMELFTLGLLTSSLDSFSCGIAEYDEYLLNEALMFQRDQIALTWLFRERATRNIAAYMSLIVDAIKLSISEKEAHRLAYPFKTIPAMKIAKLAVSAPFREQYSGIGSLMIDMAVHW